jgi:hypothetical protein
MGIFDFFRAAPKKEPKRIPAMMSHKIINIEKFYKTIKVTVKNQETKEVIVAVKGEKDWYYYPDYNLIPKKIPDYVPGLGAFEWNSVLHSALVKIERIIEIESLDNVIEAMRNHSLGGSKTE